MIMRVNIRKVVGRVGFEPTTPAMSRLQESDDESVGAQEFESRQSHHYHHSSGGARWSNSSPSHYHLIINWQQFHQFLLQRMTPKTAEDRIRYAKQYARVLQSGIPDSMLQLPPNKRIHVMKALSSLARFTGQQDKWRAIRQQYGLQWSTGTEKLDAFTRFFDDSKSLDTMMQWLREALEVLPTNYANFYLFCTVTGLRASECVEAVRLLNSFCSGTEHKDTRTIMGEDSPLYYNPEQKILQHYRFPELFIRRTKTVYISVVDDSIVSIARKIGKAPPL
jgi:hypothetical protein